jgi:hypothetical protein
VEAALCTHHFVFAGDFASQLECSVVGLGPLLQKYVLVRPFGNTACNFCNNAARSGE